MNFRLQITTYVTTLLLLQHFFVVETATPRCHCFQFIRAVRPKIIKDFQILPKTTHCSRTEIILTVLQENTEIDTCLDPESKQGKKLLRCWKRIQNDPNKKRKCIESKQNKVPKQIKKKRRNSGNTRSKHQQL
ncbi:C-X-C motif chemokine 9-like [Heptranchias perlo]|uniref:C-X-C motif chemokine 9-like n=1 Tax=Heptranchias perlo TaxID=212740 RepID=UPI0035597BEE